MKPTRISVFLILIWLLTACAPSVTRQPSQLPSLTASLMPTATQPAATLTPAFTGTNTRTATTTFTLTPTPLDTLAPEKALETIQPLIMHPMNCAVPCFMGMVPGITTMAEARTFFSHLGYKPDEGKEQNSDKRFYTISFDPDLGLHYVTLYTTNNLIENITINPEITKKEGIPRDWSAYSPETLIRKFGKPSRVYFNVYWGEMASNVVSMILYFDNLNLIAYYSGVNMVPPVPRSPLFCPLTDSIDYVRLWIGANPPDAPDPEGIDSADDSYPLEQVTTLTLDQFTQLMLGDPYQACFTINGKYWPNY